MSINRKKAKFYFLSFLKHDFKASITVFFVALPLCLGISLASGAPVFSGLLAGIIGGLVVSVISKSQLSVSGPAAGLTAICATAIAETGAFEIFLMSVCIAGLFQVLLGVFKLGSFTHLIPSSVIKGMLAAIGIILISKQVPLIIGYNQPDFWTNELFNILTLDHAFQHINNLYHNITAGAILISIICFAMLAFWKKYAATKIPFIPASFITVLTGALLAVAFQNSIFLQLSKESFVSIPTDVFSQIKTPSWNDIFQFPIVWKYAVIITFVASLETLLGLEAIDKLDPQKRITPQNRELIAQGVGNMFSGMAGGLPITAVIVRASANAEAGAKTKLSSFAHGLWLLLILLVAIPVVNFIPYCVLAVILIRTGFNLAKPKMIMQVYRQGKEQFMPFIVTVIAILLTDLLVGVLIGVAYSIYFLIQHTYRAGFTVNERADGHLRHFNIDLAMNVSFLNKKKIRDLLDSIPSYAIVEISGVKSIYIDHDILEIFQEFKTKAHDRHIQLSLKNIPEVQIIALH